MQIAGSLVWVKGLRGPVAEKWPADSPERQRSGSADRKEVLAEHPLSPDAYAMSILILEQRFPAPQNAGDPS